MPRVTVGSLPIFFRTAGNPELPTMVLAHPVGSDHGIWDAVVPRLTTRFHVVRFDAHGHGATGTVADEYAVGRLADDLLGLLDALEIQDFSICGISLGGLTGLELAARGGGRLRQLIVANAAARLPLTAEQWNERIAKVKADGMRSLADGMIERMFSPKFRQEASAEFHTAVTTFVQMSPAGYAAGLAALRDADYLGRLKDISVPTLIVGSREDLAVPASAVQAMSDAIPLASLHMLDGGHLSAIENPVGLANAILQLAAG